jgi:hypothetical protein
LEVSGKLHAQTALFPGKELAEPTGWEAVWAPDLDDVERRVLPGLELRPLGRPARIKSLYQLS